MFSKLLPALILALGVCALASELPSGSPDSWNLQEAVTLLNDSPWARTATFTRLIGGVGSGLAGEKEIYSTFYTRLLSAPPIRQALARVHKIQAGYDDLSTKEQAEVDANLQPGLDADMSNWLVISVTFRSNDLELENEVERFFDKESKESLVDAAFLSTGKLSKIRLAAYAPPQGDGVGAKFIFPRFIDGQPVVTPQSRQILFELDVPGADPELAVTFVVSQMVQDGELIL